MNNFNTLAISQSTLAWQHLFDTLNVCHNLPSPTWLDDHRILWQQLHSNQATFNHADSYHTDSWDYQLSQWLIMLFNHAFADTHTVLVRGGDEPEYFAPKSNQAPKDSQSDSQSAQIVFAHGYVASALHEISHWCIAGKQRRMLDDFGYWYCPDGRDEAAQAKFEQVEIRPQAVECLLTLALKRPFFVSADNLTANFNAYESTFEQDVFNQATNYLNHPTSLPKDAQKLLVILLILCHDFR